MKAVRTAVRICLLTEKYKLQKEKEIQKDFRKAQTHFHKSGIGGSAHREKGNNSMKTNKPQLIPVRSLTRN